MDSTNETYNPWSETYNPWSIVNLVFRHLADEGLRPMLGEAGDPSVPAAALLSALGITPSTDSSKNFSRRVSDELARLREAFEAEDPRLDQPAPPLTSHGAARLRQPLVCDQARGRAHRGVPGGVPTGHSCLRLRTQTAPRRCVMRTTRTFPSREGCR
jgi:hypothetical protein